jgi:3-oxoacyl-(acyl-carrier-protein) synthase
MRPIDNTLAVISGVQRDVGTVTQLGTVAAAQQTQQTKETAEHLEHSVAKTSETVGQRINADEEKENEKNQSKEKRKKRQEAANNEPAAVFGDMILTVPPDPGIKPRFDFMA